MPLLCVLNKYVNEVIVKGFFFIMSEYGIMKNSLLYVRRLDEGEEKRDCHRGTTRLCSTYSALKEYSYTQASYNASIAVCTCKMVCCSSYCQPTKYCFILKLAVTLKG